MIEKQIRARGVRDERVLRVMRHLPREKFMPPDVQPHAYEDRALSIGHDQTISQPYMVAAMTERLQLAPSHRVLEIGTGSGYQTAVLAQLVASVYTIERIAPLLEQTRVLFQSSAITNIHYRIGDGSLGWPEHAPFDRILVTAGAPQLPRQLVDQLNPNGGRLVIPLGPHKHQTLTLIEKRNNNITEQRDFACRFVKLIGDDAWSDVADPE